MILAAAIAAASVSPILAQDNNFAPAAGEFSVEVQFNPFSNDFGTFKLDQLKGRYFFSDKDAVRFGIGFGFDNVKTTPDPDNNDEIWSKGKLGTFSIDLGYERHFFNYKRIDLYAGAGLGYALQSVSATNQWLDGDDKLRETKICNAMTRPPTIPHMRSAATTNSISKPSPASTSLSTKVSSSALNWA